MTWVVDGTQCTGCGACLVACPVTATSMDDHPDGFAHAMIDDNTCIHCGRCTKVCPVHNPPELRSQEAVYVAQSPSREVLLSSASGGAFYELAHSFLREGGVVYGAVMHMEHSVANVVHEAARDEVGLARQQNSKYVLGEAYPIFREVEQTLKEGERVLFAGLPCQVAGLYGYLGHDYDSLFTIDIFCHGNTSLTHLNLYLAHLEKKHRSEVVRYSFRDKSRGVGYKPRYELANGKIVCDTALQEVYWYLFQNSKFFRESCHTCPYACPKRVGDLSLGDFWGIERVRPELLTTNGGPLDPAYGISAALVNSTKGTELVRNTELKLESSTIEEVSVQGEAVRMPQPKPADRDLILKMFRDGNYAKIKRYCIRQMRLGYLIDLVFDTAPVQALRKLLGRT